MTRNRIAAGAALLALVALVVALLDPHTGSARPRAVLAVDRSASIDASMRDTETTWLDALAADPRGCIAPCRVISFAGSADTLPLGAPALAMHAPAGAQAGATDLEQGIAAAVAAAPDGGRVVALSDGGETAGDATAAVTAARARGITIDAVPLADGSFQDAAITRLDAPRVVRKGDTISLLVTVHASTFSSGALVVAHDGGTPVGQPEAFHPGDNPFTLSYTATTTGWHSFAVSVSSPGDRQPRNNTLSVGVEVGAAPHAVVVSSSVDPPIAAILTAKGIRTTVEPASSLPATAAGYSAIDALVLDDLPASSLGSQQIAALGAAIRTTGMGMLTLGGPQAYSLGGYAHSGLNNLLPLASLVPGDLQRRNLALELVLDRSGSMTDTSRGVPKIQMAQSAAKQAATFVSKHQDEFGVVDFDIVPHLLLPMRRVATSALASAINQQIDRLHADGGTDIYLALQQGYRQVLKSTSPNRHIILLTDGISQPHNYTALLQALVKHHITVATVALGSDVDSDLLQQISSTTGGNYYATTNARDLPKIFIKETRLSARPVEIRGRQQIVPQDSSPIVRSLVGKKLPAVTGNVVTRLQVGAQAGLLAKSGTASSDPALAEWSVGLGRVVSWTPGLGAPWATSWLAETSLWDDATRFAARGLPEPVVAASAQEGQATTLQVDLGAAPVTSDTTLPAVLEDGKGGRRAVTLRETSPSLFTATVPARAPDSYGLTLSLPASLGGSQRVLVDVPYPSEYRPATTGGAATLGELTAQTGGKLLKATSTPVFATASRSWRTPLLVLALVLVAGSIALRLLVRSSRPGRPPAAERPADREAAPPPLVRD